MIADYAASLIITLKDRNSDLGIAQAIYGTPADKYKGPNVVCFDIVLT